MVLQELRHTKAKTVVNALSFHDNKSQTCFDYVPFATKNRLWHSWNTWYVTMALPVTQKTVSDSLLNTKQLLHKFHENKITIWSSLSLLLKYFANGCHIHQNTKRHFFPLQHRFCWRNTATPSFWFLSNILNNNNSRMCHTKNHAINTRRRSPYNYTRNCNLAPSHIQFRDSHLTQNLPIIHKHDKTNHSDY